MKQGTYLDFTLRLFDDAQDGLQVQVIHSSPAGDRPVEVIAEHPTRCPVPATKIQAQREVLATAIGIQGRSRRAREAMRRLGGWLYHMLFPEPVWEIFIERFRRAREQGAGLRLRLLVEPEEMVSWPFEYIFFEDEHATDAAKATPLIRHLAEDSAPADDQNATRDNGLAGFLALHPGISIVRLGSLKSEAVMLAPSDELRILVVYCNLQHDVPTTVQSGDEEFTIHWPFLDSLAAERDAILHVLRPLEEQNPKLAHVDVLANPTPEQLLARLQHGFHTFVYLGHGYSNRDGALGRKQTCGLVLDNGYGRHAYLEARELAEALAQTPVRLALLNACETMHEENPGQQYSTARAIAERGIATIAMHFKQPDAAGLVLGDAFWRALARHSSIDACLSHAREVLATTLTQDRPEWGNAALIMHGHDGMLLARPADIERANYARMLERRFPTRTEAKSSPLFLAEGDREPVADFVEALTRHSKLVIVAPDVVKVSAGAVSNVRGGIESGRLRPGTLPILINLDRWSMCPNDLSHYLASHLQDLGLAASFSDVLMQRLRDGLAVSVFESPDEALVPANALSWIADIAGGIGHASQMLVVLKPSDDYNALARIGFTVAKIGLNPSNGPLEARVWVAPMAFSRTRDIEVLPRTTSARFRLGDPVTIHFWSNEDCYLSLLNYGTSGKIHRLFPNPLHPNPFIRGNRVHQIPDPAHEFLFRLGGPQGTERIRAIATRSPDQALRASGASGGQLFSQPSDLEIEALNKVVGEANQSNCAVAECQIEVLAAAHEG